MAAFTAAQYDRGDRCGGRGSRLSARFSGRVAPVVRARTPEISAVLVATPLRDSRRRALVLLLPKRRGRRVRSDAATPEGARVVVTEDAHRYTPVHVPPAAERGGCGQAGSGRGDRCGSSSRAVAAAAGRRLRAPVAVTSIAPYRRGGCIGGRRGKGTRHPMPGLCAGPLSLPGLGDRGGGHWHHDRRNWAPHHTTPG
jgi:hypothetical protein